jgi:hypothetical protein
MGLFDDSSYLENRSFSSALGPFQITPEDEYPAQLEKISIFVDETGTVNVDEQLYLYKQTDPIDAPYKPTWSADNNFVKSLQTQLGVPMFSVITYPTFKVEGADVEDLEASFANLQVKFPEDTPEGFVPCNGWVWEIEGVKYATPYLIDKSVTTGAGVNAVTTTSYLAPPGCAFMIKLPTGNVDGVTSRTLFGRVVDVDDISKPLGTWGSPG